MGVVDQGALRLSGIPSEGPPFSLWISQGFNRHGCMRAGIWVSEEIRRAFQIDMPITLELFTESGETIPIFHGIVTKGIIKKEKGQSCLYLEAETGSVLLDRIKKTRSFQRKGRSYQELVGEIAAPYQGYPVWKSKSGEETECGFLLQYEETDWEFLKRVASVTGNVLLPEARFLGNGFYVGLPDSQGETELKADSYILQSQMTDDIREDGTLCAGPEYVIEDSLQLYHPGERVLFLGQLLAVSERESRLERGVLKSRYVLRGEDNFQAAPVYNYQMIGASVAGTVEESSPNQSRISLSTDGGGERADSWHERPIFYSGGGRGYSGRPENGDRLYLYFPTEHEKDRFVIGGGGAGYEALRAVTQQVMDDTAAQEEEAEKGQALHLGVELPSTGEEVPRAVGIQSGEGKAASLQSAADQPETTQPAGVQPAASGKTKQANAATMPAYKNWSTPGNQALSLNTGGIRLQTGSGSAIGMGSGGISLTSHGNASLKGKNGLEIELLHGTQVSLHAEEYIYLQCGMSAVAILPEEIHIRGTKVWISSSLNSMSRFVVSDESLAGMKEDYYNRKWGSPLQLFMPDGTAIGRVKGLEENEALRKYFKENVLGTEGYINYLDDETLDPYYKNGMIEEDSKAFVEQSLYLRWLSATYGKTDMEKFADWLVTKEGFHATLDVVGIFFEPADAVNAVAYLLEGDWGNAALSGISVIPMLGDFFGKGGKGSQYALKLADLTKLKRNEKVIKALDNIDIFIKARKAQVGELQKWIGKNLDDLIGGGYVVECVTPEGFVYKVRVRDDFHANIHLMDESGDVVHDTIRYGDKAGDGGKAANEGSGTQSKVKPPVPGDPDFVGPLPTENYGRLEIISSGTYSQSEVNAARYLAENGNDVVLRPPVGTSVLT